MARILRLTLLGTLFAGCHPATPAKPHARPDTPVEQEARVFLEQLTPLLQPAVTAAAEAAWIAATDVSPEHTGARAGAEKVAAALSGSRFVIDRTRGLLKNQSRLNEMTRRQLEKLLLTAAENPATVADVVAARIEAEARQSEILDGFTFCRRPGKPGGNTPCAQAITANDIDDVLQNSRDLIERRDVWTVSKQIGVPLKPGLVKLVNLRNQLARAMGYRSFFELQVADYGMSVPEMMKLLDDTLVAIQPLFEGLHCLARHTLADRFKQPVPRHIPAHWIGNRWAQEWPGLVEAADLDPLFADRTPQAIVKAAEYFYTSLGFEALPASFWTASDLYPVPAGSARKKNAHASAWHMDGERDVRSLMSVQSNSRWFGTAHHEMGHIYYYLSYARPEVPYLLRTGANRAFHEAVGELAKLASEQAPYLIKTGFMAPDQAPDADAWLLGSAMDSIVFLPWAAGVMSHFEHDLYEEELPPEVWQERWWQYVRQHQGVVPPDPRTDPALCDACTKTHINDDAAQYYDYALATLIKFQLHDHICTQILKQDVRACDYSGQHAVGDFLRGILSQGATRDWRHLIEDATGHPIGPRALLEFYQPLIKDLQTRNRNRACQPI